MIIPTIASITEKDVPASKPTTEKHPRGVFKCRAPLLSPMAHARGIKMIPRETAHTLKDTRHFCSTPVHLPAERLSLATLEHLPTRPSIGARISGRDFLSLITPRIPRHTSSAPTSFPTRQIRSPTI